MRLCGYSDTDVIIPHFSSVSEMLSNGAGELIIYRHGVAAAQGVYQGEYQGSGADVRLAGGDLDGQRVNGDSADAYIGLQCRRVARVRGRERLRWPRLCEGQRKAADARLQGEPDLHFSCWHSSLPLRPRGLSAATWQWRAPRSVRPVDYTRGPASLRRRSRNSGVSHISLGTPTIECHSSAAWR